MNAEVLSEVEYQPPYEETTAEVEAVSAEFPCENKLGFTALCASCYLVRLYGDCPKNIRENAAKPEDPLSDDQESLLSTFESPIFSLDSETTASETTYIAPVQEVIPVQKAAPKAPLKKQPVEEVALIAEPEKAPARSYRDLLFDDAIEVVVASPRMSQAAIAPKPLPVHVLEQETIAPPIYEAPLDILKTIIAEIEITPKPLVMDEPFTEPIIPAGNEPLTETVVILEEAAPEAVVPIAPEEAKRVEAIIPARSIDIPTPLPALEIIPAIAPVSTPELIISESIAIEPEIEMIDEIVSLIEPELPVQEVVLDIFEEQLAEVAIEEVTLVEPEIIPKDSEAIIEPQEAQSIENDYSNTVTLSDNHIEFSEYLTNQDLAAPNTPERLLPTIQKYSGVSFRYARSFIGAFALLTLVLIDR